MAAHSREYDDLDWLLQQELSRVCSVPNHSARALAALTTRIRQHLPLVPPELARAVLRDLGILHTSVRIIPAAPAEWYLLRVSRMAIF